MKAWVLGLVLAIAGVVACGEGLLILNVDVFSFVQGTGQDTIPYVIPLGGSNVTVDNVPQRFSLPGGLSCSVVKEGQLTGTANLINTSGSGSLEVQAFVAADSAGTFDPGALAGRAGPVTVSGPGTTPITMNADLAALLTLFTQPELWVRFVVQGSNTGITPVEGRAAPTALDLRIVVQDELC